MNSIPTPFQTIGLFGRVKNAGVAETLNHLVTFLNQLGQAWIIEAETADNLTIETKAERIVTREQLSQRCQLMVVIGGDGSLLHAAQLVIENEIPIVGINRGKLGFLTDIAPCDFNPLKAILQGQFMLEKRFLLKASIYHENTLAGEACALNEVALIPDNLPHMNAFEMYVGEQFVCSQNADGLIIATPTGSTAYALSAGGPILHPGLNAIVIVPMFPHTLNHRSIVIDGDQAIRLHLSQHNSHTARITCDGQTAIDTPPGSQILIKKKTQLLQLLHPLNYDYYASLRSKLHWGRKLVHTI